MMGDEYISSPFDEIRQVNEREEEYWSARDLHKILGYTQWRNFYNVVIKRAKTACEENGEAASDHFVQSYKVVSLGSGSQRKTEDMFLTRYAAYLVVMNGDPKMPVVALGQAYFAIQTRRQELADDIAFASLPEDQKRLVMRTQMSTLNQQLAVAAQRAGVIQPVDFSVFQNHGYKGLYGGETENAIHTRKQLKPQGRILDYMGSDELAYNSFRASLTRQKIDHEQLQKKNQANTAHYEMGQEVRNTIIRTGATLPEQLPTPSKSIQQLEREEQRRLKYKDQLSLLDIDQEELH